MYFVDANFDAYFSISLLFFIIFTMFYIFNKSLDKLLYKRIQSNYLYHNKSQHTFFFTFNYYPTHVISCSTASRKPAWLSWMVVNYKVQTSYKWGTLVPIYIILFSFKKPATDAYLNNWISFCLIPLIHVWYDTRCKTTDPSKNVGNIPVCLLTPVDIADG